jgi:4-diphosphocytidyl-2-C-methyl-D-erythritol kinase
MSLAALHDVPAPAKLNLFLHVVGRRADGYHLLQSAFALIDWSDVLHFERRADGRLARHDLGTALPADDLCLRAARLLQTESGSSFGADISIDKRVPWGAGLGGGSSDAASTLLALNRLWGLHWPRERLLALGLALGADVPFFLGGTNAWVEGIGERLTPIELPTRWWAVLKPAVALPTAAIFGSPTLVRNTPAATILDFLADPLGFGRNDLQGPAEGYSSEVSKAMALLQARFGASRMTGSGSAVFAEVGAVDRAPRDRVEAMPLPAAWTGRTCRGLSRHPLADWAQG